MPSMPVKVRSVVEPSATPTLPSRVVMSDLDAAESKYRASSSAAHVASIRPVVTRGRGSQ